MSNQAELINQLSSIDSAKEAIPLIGQLTRDGDRIAAEGLLQTLHHHHLGVVAAAVEGLVQLGTNAVEPLLNKFKTCRDHGIQAYIVQALARIEDARALDLLIEMVGVEVANHCQGNVRRVAARGLGKIGKTANNESIIQRCVEKLTWALFNAEDWGLRYAAVVSLQEIGTAKAVAILQQALSGEAELVVQERIRTALEN
jgi:HEAT repeat protein